MEYPGFQVYKEGGKSLLDNNSLALLIAGPTYYHPPV
jgi:hypothetical protein